MKAQGKLFDVQICALSEAALGELELFHATSLEDWRPPPDPSSWDERQEVWRQRFRESGEEIDAERPAGWRDRSSERAREQRGKGIRFGAAGAGRPKEGST